MGNENKIPKKILLVDDSALMRRVLCDILNSDERFEVTGRASDGQEALELMGKKDFDAVVLDISMPRMDGLQMLREMRKRRIPARVMMLSAYTYEGAKLLLEALSLGALDFMHKPNTLADWDIGSYQEMLLETLDIVANGEFPIFDSEEERSQKKAAVKESAPPKAPVSPGASSGIRIVAIASSTGGPRALQSVIPRLPKELDAPVLLVQHMAKGFTGSLAERLDSLSSLSVKEAKEGEEIAKGTVYVSMGGQHMTVRRSPGGKHVIRYTDEPSREGVKPCANYMYESLIESGYDPIICVVLTGMGADGTEGIQALRKAKNTYVIAQNQETCTVYGMPKSAVNAGLVDEEIPLDQIAREIVTRVGVRNA